MYIRTVKSNNTLYIIMHYIHTLTQHTGSYAVIKIMFYINHLLAPHYNGVATLYGVEGQGSEVIIQLKFSRGLHIQSMRPMFTYREQGSI